MRIRFLFLTLLAMTAVLLFAGCSDLSGVQPTAPVVPDETAGKSLMIPDVTNVEVHYNPRSCTAWITWTTSRTSYNDVVRYGPVGGPYQTVPASGGRFHTSHTFDFSHLPKRWEFFLEGDWIGFPGGYNYGPDMRSRPLCLGGIGVHR